MRNLFIAIVLSVVVSLLGSPARADITDYGFDRLDTDVQDPIGGYVVTPAVGPFPGSWEDTASSGNSTATTTYNFFTSPSYARFKWDFRHARGAGYARSIGTVSFSVDADTDYSISGAYSLDGTGACYTYARLVEPNTNTYLFGNNQESHSTVDESFVLGEMGGDVGNWLTGALSGTLTAGHTYTFTYNNFVEFVPGADLTASGSGCVELTLGNAPVPVPAPGALTLGLIGLGMVAWVRKRRMA